MFDKMAKKLAEKMGRTVKEAAEPIRAGVKQAASNKVDLYSRILRLGILIVLFVEGTRKIAGDSGSQAGTGQIVINNYLSDRKEGR